MMRKGTIQMSINNYQAIIESFEDAVIERRDMYRNEADCRRMLILGMLSDAQEEINLGMPITAKKTINSVKIILDRCL